MTITEIKVSLRNEEKLKAFVAVTFDDCFVVKNMKVIADAGNVILCMPSRKSARGTYKDIAHPITAAFRAILEEAIFAAYQEEVAKVSRRREL